MKTLIFVESRHHGNTRKVVNAIAEAYDEVTIMDVNHMENVNLASYQCIGLASGIEYGKFYEKVAAQAEKIPAGKKVILIYTCGSPKKDQSGSVREILDKKGARIIGTFRCKGWDSYGPLGMFGGVNRKSPTTADLSAAVNFYKKMREG